LTPNPLNSSLSPLSPTSSSLLFFKSCFTFLLWHSLPVKLLIWVQFGYYFEIHLKTKVTFKGLHGSREGKNPKEAANSNRLGCGVKQASSSAPSRLPDFNY
jgi:hypothetical protein